MSTDYSDYNPTRREPMNVKTSVVAGLGSIIIANDEENIFSEVEEGDEG
jgi:hypothetical protein